MMLQSWVESIVSAQEIRSIELRVGEKARIRFGVEKGHATHASSHCPDCAVTPGLFHVPCCDTEECPNCAGQLISCGCLLVVSTE